MIEETISKLVRYGLEKNLLHTSDAHFVYNQLLERLKLDGSAPFTWQEDCDDLSSILSTLCDDAIARGIISEDSIVCRDLFDTSLMGILTPRPSSVIATFQTLYHSSPKHATDWFYMFSQDTNYIRTDRIAKDQKWTTETPYGTLDLTINLSKPEKDPKAIAAARNLTASCYPNCQLCRENEGYAGRINHPARQNHRIIPITIHNSPWFFQYSPYVYYPEHCIVFHGNHVPMKIDRDCFAKLLDFVHQFPHYFVGSNADLPIVGGSILTHDHFQGGHYTFAMAKAPIETHFSFADFPEVEAGMLRWPMSVIRLRSRERESLIHISDRILQTWRNYSDQTVSIYAQTNGQPHNTITPIARYRNGAYEMDLVLRNNLTTPEHPLGLYHPHAELHHIKKENIGLIEVMGLAVLPARLQSELAELERRLISGEDLHTDERTAKHADWAYIFMKKYPQLSAGAIHAIIQKEVGLVFMNVLEHAGVYKRTTEGNRAFLNFLKNV